MCPFKKLIASIAGFLSGAREQMDNLGTLQVLLEVARENSRRNGIPTPSFVPLIRDNYEFLHFFTGRRPECLPLPYSFQLIVRGMPERIQKRGCRKRC
jgi:hypothetical protein